MTPDALFAAVESRQLRGSLGAYTGAAYRDCTPAEVPQALRELYAGLDRRVRYDLLHNSNFCCDCGVHIKRNNTRCWECNNVHRSELEREQAAEHMWHSGKGPQ